MNRITQVTRNWSPGLMLGMVLVLTTTPAHSIEANVSIGSGMNVPILNERYEHNAPAACAVKQSVSIKLAGLDNSDNATARECCWMLVGGIWVCRPEYC